MVKGENILSSDEEGSSESDENMDADSSLSSNIGMECSSHSSSSDGESDDDEQSLTSNDLSDHSADKLDIKLQDALSYVGGFVTVENTPTDLVFSPTHNVLGVTTVNGDIEILCYESLLFTHIGKIECFENSSCRGLVFSDDGNTIYTFAATEGFVIIDSQTEQIINYCKLEGRNHLTTLKVLDDTTLCTGDDKGFINYWDTRIFNPTTLCKSFKSGMDGSNDYISDILLKDDKNFIATGSGSGQVTVFERRNLKVLKRDTQYPSDLTGLCSVRHSMIIAGTLQGDFYFTQWDDKEATHRYFVSKKGCNEIIKLKEDLILSAWDDCQIRMHMLFPHKEVGILGRQPFPPENIALTPDKTILVSDSIDKKIRIWDLSKMNIKNRQKYKNIRIKRTDNFFNDL